MINFTCFNYELSDALKWVTATIDKKKLWSSVLLSVKDGKLIVASMSYQFLELGNILSARHKYPFTYRIASVDLNQPHEDGEATVNIQGLRHALKSGKSPIGSADLDLKDVPQMVFGPVHEILANIKETPEIFSVDAHDLKECCKRAGKLIPHDNEANWQEGMLELDGGKLTVTLTDNRVLLQQQLDMFIDPEVIPSLRKLPIVKPTLRPMIEESVSKDKEPPIKLPVSRVFLQSLSSLKLSTNDMIDFYEIPKPVYGDPVRAAALYRDRVVAVINPYLMLGLPPIRPVDGESHEVSRKSVLQGLKWICGRKRTAEVPVKFSVDGPGYRDNIELVTYRTTPPEGDTEALFNGTTLLRLLQAMPDREMVVVAQNKYVVQKFPWKFQTTKGNPVVGIIQPMPSYM